MLSLKSSNNDARNNVAAEHLVPVGRVLHTHGTAGELAVYPYLNDRAYYERLHDVILGDKQAQLISVRQTRERILLQLAGVTSLEAARSLVGCELFVPRDSVPPPEVGEFYWFDLEGLAVVTEEGECLGRVTDFFPTGSNDVLVVYNGEREILLPFIKDVIVCIDKMQSCVRIRVLPGLL